MKQIVSIRIPKSLTKQLKEFAIDKHYMDVSEVVRALLRKKWLEYRDPYSTQVKQLRKDVTSKINKIAQKKSYEQLMDELDMIKKELKKKAGESK